MVPPHSSLLFKFENYFRVWRRFEVCVLPKKQNSRGENLVGGEGLFGWASLVLWPHYYYYHVGGGGRCLIRAFSKKEGGTVNQRH